MRRVLGLALSCLLSWPVLAQEDPRARADALAAGAGMRKEVFKAGVFTLTTYARLGDPSQPLRVYIEGDGLAWISRGRLSPDPTPRKALGLVLATEDKSANVVYVARPCQYTPRAQDRRCEPQYWSLKRFAPEVVNAVNQAIGHYAARQPGRPIQLVGYSGGGAVAALVAARRQDVESLRSVAGNLDHVLVNRINGVTQLRGSLNAVDVAPSLSGLPQIHFSGAADKVVPPVVAQSFAARAGPCAQVITVPGATHETGWVEAWPALLAQTPTCP